MDSNTKLPAKQFYWLIAACAFIIFSECLLVLMRVKNPENYEVWVEVMGEHMTFEVYTAIHMSHFFMKVIIPVMLGVYAYVAYIKVRIGKLFVFIWTVLLVGGMAYTVIELDFSSVFYYIRLIGYILAIVTILSLINVIKEQKVE